MAVKDRRNAVSYYRMCLPAEVLRKQLLEENIELVADTKLDLNQDWDAIILHGVVQPHWIEVLEEIKERGVKVAISLDDDIWNIPTHNPAVTTYKELEKDTLTWCCDLADSILASTEPLAMVVMDKISNRKPIHVCPNLLDWTAFPSPIKRQEPIKILWAGSVHHIADLDEICEPLERLMTEFKEKIQVLFMGAHPVHFCEWRHIIGTDMAKMIPNSKYGPSLGFINPVDLNDYPATLCNVAADIGICPLTNEKFNESKSVIKAAEYALSGCAVVTSDMPPYQPMDNSIQRVQPGDKEGWYNTLKHLIEDEECRKTWAEMAFIRALYTHTWKNSTAKTKWLNFFRSL